MMKFFNLIAGEVKRIYGNKVLVGPSLVVCDEQTCDEVITAKNLGHCSNFDVIYNNFYANGTTTNPYLTYTGFNTFQYWADNQGSNKLNFILSECGMPRSTIDINSIPAGYSRKGTKGRTYLPSELAGIYQDTEVMQGDLAKNLVEKSVKDGTYPNVQGLLFFGNGDNPGRLSLNGGYGIAEYENFFIPPKNFVSTADTLTQVTNFQTNPNGTFPNGKLHIWCEEFMSHLWKDTPRQLTSSSPLGELQATGFIDSFATLQTKESDAMIKVRTIIATGIPNLIYPNEL
jgi:hypothetical protein